MLTARYERLLVRTILNSLAKQPGDWEFEGANELRWARNAQLGLGIDYRWPMTIQLRGGFVQPRIWNGLRIRWGLRRMILKRWFSEQA